MRAAGVNLVTVGVFSWALLEPRPGELDFGGWTGCSTCSTRAASRWTWRRRRRPRRRGWPRATPRACPSRATGCACRSARARRTARAPRPTARPPCGWPRRWPSATRRTRRSRCGTSTTSTAPTRRAATARCPRRLPLLARAPPRDPGRPQRGLGHGVLEPALRGLGGDPAAPDRAVLLQSGAGARLPPLLLRRAAGLLRPRARRARAGHAGRAGHHELHGAVRAPGLLGVGGRGGRGLPRRLSRPGGSRLARRRGPRGDLMRSLRGGQPWMLMEQAAERGELAAAQPPKRPGAMRRISLQAVARGADAIMYFQWRAAQRGSERFHSAMLPHAGTDSRVAPRDPRARRRARAPAPRGRRRVPAQVAAPARLGLVVGPGGPGPPVHAAAAGRPDPRPLRAAVAGQRPRGPRPPAGRPVGLPARGRAEPLPPQRGGGRGARALRGRGRPPAHVVPSRASSTGRRRLPRGLARAARRGARAVG
jgi:hypothetical protein